MGGPGLNGIRFVKPDRGTKTLPRLHVKHVCLKTQCTRVSCTPSTRAAVEDRQRVPGMVRAQNHTRETAYEYQNKKKTTLVEWQKKKTITIDYGEKK